MRRHRLGGRTTALNKIRLLSDISEAGLKKIENKALWLNFTAAEEVLRKTDDGNDVFILISGLMHVIIFSASGKAVGFRRIHAGGIFGEFAAIDGQKRSAAVAAITDCDVLKISAALFWDLIKTEPGFTESILKHMTLMLRDMTARIYEFSTLAVKNRIQAEILRMAKKDLALKTGPMIAPAPTHAEIANRVSTHREAVSRELSRLTKLGIIERKGRTLSVKDLPRLERIVQDASGE